MTPNLIDEVGHRVVVLDGGFSTQLSCHVGEIVDGDPLWSARFLATHPKDVINTHLDFLRAGAEIIMTNTYQASISGFVQYLNLTEEASLNLIKEAVYLAKTAVDQFIERYSDNNQIRPLIVGSVGPYGASLHDGSEYTGEYAETVTKKLLRDWHLPRVQALIEAGVDMLAFETIPCQKEGEVLVELLQEFPDMKAWLTFSCSKDGVTICNGDNFENAVRKCYAMCPEQLVGLGVNCIGPKFVGPLLKSINTGAEPFIPLVVYPNSGENYTLEYGWIDRDKCEPLEGYVPTWLELGVMSIGGCCRTYAADVSRIRNEVSTWCSKQHLKNGSD